MKISTAIITLLAASSTYSHYIKREIKIINGDNNGNTQALGETDGLIGVGDNKSTGTGDVDQNAVNNCKTGIKEYTECITVKEKISKSNIDKYCETFNSEKCKKLFRQGILNVVPSCSSIPKGYQKQIKKKYDTLNYTFKLLCATDETKQYCPLSNSYITNGNAAFNNEGFNKAVQETCKSKACTDAAIEAFVILERSDAINTTGNKSTGTGTGTSTPNNIGGGGIGGNVGGAGAGAGTDNKTKRDIVINGGGNGSNNNTPGNTPGGSPGNTPGGNTGNTPGGSPGNTPGGNTGNTPGGSPGNTPGGNTGNTPGGSPGSPGNTPGGNTPGGSPGGSPGGNTGNSPAGGNSNTSIGVGNGSPLSEVLAKLRADQCSSQSKAMVNGGDPQNASGAETIKASTTLLITICVLLFSIF
ncbi:hypothetical protein BCR32DRAFT_329835 [Anaeromyces robustus]|uniref:Uncharacterized protein n=1 Tax=Anaeromyces robustus TaxID=1754192 RepID=A0A1Y1WQ19_9FUNG|nr:hypothetical protein BCR32DRAFT_329835 [Anaeromyces robustus]|eukprot:ORX75388.1 hypothetical protein BCR32DRAFT_329835 [Anaeromyces robustus]